MSQTNPFASQDLPEPPSPPKSGGMKTLAACGCGCAVLLLILAIAAVLLFRHFFGPGDQVPTDHLLGEDTVFVAHMDAPVNDAGAKEFIAELVHMLSTLDPERMDEETQEAFSDILESTEELSMDDAMELVGLMPNSMTFLVEDTGTELSSIFGLNLSQGSRLLHYFISQTAGSSGWETEDWDEFEIIKPQFNFNEGSLPTDDEDGVLVPLDVQAEVEIGEVGYVGFQHDTFVWSSEIETMKRALKRTAYVGEPGPPVGSSLRSDLDSLRERWLISTVLRNSPRLDLPSFGSGFLEALLGSTEEDSLLFASPEELEWMATDFGRSTSGIGFVGDDLVLRIEVNGLSEGDVSKVTKGFEALLGRIAEDLGQSELILAHEVIQGSTSIAINANLEDLRLWMQGEFAKSEAITARANESLDVLDAEAE